MQQAPVNKAKNLPRVHETVVHMLADACRHAGDTTALMFQGRALSYTEYLRCVGGFARELVEFGVRRERVALVCANSIEMAVAMFAAHAAGAQVIPINPIYTARELEYILKDSEPRVVIYDGNVAPVVEPLSARLGIAHRIRLGPEGGRLLDTWRNEAATHLPQPLPSAGDLATLQYTGGTTGLPKGVNITHAQMSVNISQREAVLPTNPDDETILCIMPLFHVFAVSMCLHLSAYCRAKLVILPYYKSDLVFSAIAEQSVTRLPAGPTVFIGLMAAQGFVNADFSSLRTAYSGSAPLPAQTLRQWEAATGCPILEGYGQSEAGPVLTYIGEGMQRKVGSVGPPVPDTEIQIVDVDNDTKVLNTGERGEIRARGPQIMAGYRNLPKETAETLRDSWLYTGDIGELDEDGYLYIRDRKKDMVITGGYNVYPREVEEVLYLHADVEEVAVIGAPDDYRGEVLKAFVVMRAFATTSMDALLTHCQLNLAKYKVPAGIQSVSELPKTTIGKIDKNALRAIHTAASIGKQL